MVFLSKLLPTFGILVFTLYLFHVFRNLSLVYVGALSISLSVCFFLLVLKKNIQVNITILTTFFVLSYGSFVSFIYISNYGNPGAGLVRLWASFPLAIIALVLTEKHTEITFKILTIFFVIATGSIALQYLVGPISWFAEASERAGGIRFASLAGSLTAFGIFLGVPALASLYYFKRMSSISIFCILVIGALLSLQKAALVNIMLVVVFAWWLKLFASRVLSVSFLLMALVLSILLSYYLYEYLNSISAFRYLIGTFAADSSLSSDVSLLVSVFDRLMELPMISLVFFGAWPLFLGVGVFGGAGVLGYSHLPMAHNGAIETILIFGYFVGGIVLVFLVANFWHAVRLLCSRSLVARSESGFICAAYIIWFVNFLFSGGGLYHPIGAAIFWLLVLRMRALDKSVSGVARDMTQSTGVNDV